VLQATPSQQSKKVLNQFFWNEGNYPLSVDTLSEISFFDIQICFCFNRFCDPWFSPRMVSGRFGSRFRLLAGVAGFNGGWLSICLQREPLALIDSAQGAVQVG